MITTMPPLPVADATITAADLCDELAVPLPVDDGDSDGPSSPRWRHQSLSKGAAGVAILHAVRIQTGHGHERQMRAWLARSVSEDVSAGPGAGLWFGAPAIGFALDICVPHRYAQTRAALDQAVTGLTHRRLRAAHERIAASARPHLAEFDLVRGLTGLGAHLLLHDPDGDLIQAVLDYLVLLIQPIPADDEAGADVPGWWTADPPSGQPHQAGGHADQGMAHGIAGPLALLALAMRRGITVPGHAEAIDRICAWLDAWRQPGATGPWWPERITLADLRAGQPAQPGPARPSWCYGTVGLARAQQLAGLARGDRIRQAAAEDALHRCLADPAQLARLRDANLCHGWAGVAATAWYAAADAITPHLTGHLPGLLRALVEHADHTGPERHVGLIEGRAGVALTLHTIARAVHSPWPTCLLIN